MPDKKTAKHLLHDVVPHYSTKFRESAGLTSATVGQLEFARSKDIILRYLPRPPAIIVDVGGGAGLYAKWLTEEGYQVHLVDPQASKIEQAREAAKGGFTASVGDARSLPFADASMDVVLLLSALYQLTELRERLLVMKEAYRILRSGGTTLLVGVSRFASALNGLANKMMDDPGFAQIVENDLRDGQHRNPTNNHDYFSTAYFHLPEQLRTEAQQVGFRVEKQLSIEGPAWMLNNLDDYWSNPAKRERLLATIAAIEGEPSLLGVSAHFMVVARKD